MWQIFITTKQKKYPVDSMVLKAFIITMKHYSYTKLKQKKYHSKLHRSILSLDVVIKHCLYFMLLFFSDMMVAIGYLQFVCYLLRCSHRLCYYPPQQSLLLLYPPFESGWHTFYFLHSFWTWISTVNICVYIKNIVFLWERKAFSQTGTNIHILHIITFESE